MTILGTYNYLAPDIAEVADECFERAGISAATIGNDHIESFFRSLRLLLNSEWQVLGIRQWMIERVTLVTTANLANFDLPTGGLDIVSAILRRASRDTPCERMSRQDYLNIPDKTQIGRPDRYMVDRRFDRATVYLWRTPENSTDQFIYDMFKQMSQPGTTMQYTLQMPPHVLEAFHAGLAARIALKFNPQRYSLLQQLYRGPNPDKIGGALADALNEDRERADTRFTIGLQPSR